ncbi:MAG: hypothetical protein NTW16_15670 [Bacteroidetes bacterium]|nr:hypothetical protein [Bacteroidota bacterium]
MKNTKLTTIKTLYILTAFLGLQFNTIFAAANHIETPAGSNETTINISLISPVAPIVADFSDGAPVTEISLINLAPATPKEADFEDQPVVINAPSILDLAPVAPVKADFEDQV